MPKKLTNPQSQNDDDPQGVLTPDPENQPVKPDTNEEPLPEVSDAAGYNRISDAKLRRNLEAVKAGTMTIDKAGKRRARRFSKKDREIMVNDCAKFFATKSLHKWDAIEYLTEKYGFSNRRAEDIVSRAKQRIADAYDFTDDQLRSALTERFDRISRTGNASDAIAAHREIAKLRGLYETKVTVETKATPGAIASSPEVQSQIAAMLEAQRKALPAPTGEVIDLEVSEAPDGRETAEAPEGWSEGETTG